MPIRHLNFTSTLKSGYHSGVCEMAKCKADGVDFEQVARKLIVYSRSLAKGSLSTVHGAAVGEMPVLQYLAGVSGTVVSSEIADRLKYSRARMSRILESLEQKGYIVRTPDPEDRRRVNVEISEEGRAFAEAEGKKAVSALAQQLRGLGEEDAAELVRILNKAYSITYDKDDYVDE